MSIKGFSKALKVINSCETYGQWRTAQKYIELFCKNGLNNKEDILSMQFLFNQLHMKHGFVIQREYPIGEVEIESQADLVVNKPMCHGTVA